MNLESILFAAFLVALFFGGYWLGWVDAKLQIESERQIDRLFELARKGAEGEKR